MGRYQHIGRQELKWRDDKQKEMKEKGVQQADVQDKEPGK